MCFSMSLAQAHICVGLRLFLFKSITAVAGCPEAVSRLGCPFPQRQSSYVLVVSLWPGMTNLADIHL